MVKITALQPGRDREKRIKVFLDGRPAFSLDAEVTSAAGLEPGQELDQNDIERLNSADRRHRCRETALSYLDFRPRSESELRTRLRQRRFEDEDIEAVLARLKEQGLVDDEAFARFWTENREAFRPRSQRLTRLELRRKGVENSVIAVAVAAIDDNENAYQAALKKARLLSPADGRLFRRRLGDFLRRRGFGYEVTERTVNRLWQERNGTGRHISEKEVNK